ncbi:MAG: HAD family phosphatase [Hungatella sp.]|nr:HAD family hydrolase [uncultured Acetatifactor sp.]MCI9362178.1 HAD family phosphatase [Hungatella sp.]
MRVKALFMDLDGTTLQKDQIYFSMRTMYDLREVMKKGILVVPCTGRVEAMLPPQIEKENGIRYLITSGGARITDRQTGELIAHSRLSPEDSAFICRSFQGQKIYGELACDGKVLMEEDVAEHLENYLVPSHHVWFMDEKREVRVKKLSDYFLEHKTGLEKGNLYGLSPQQKKVISKALGDSGSAVMTEAEEGDLAFFPKNVTKLKGIKILLKRLGITLEETMSIGDGLIDGFMIQACGIGVAMGNAPWQIQEHADYVTGDCYEEGAAQAIERFLLS